VRITGSVDDKAVVRITKSSDMHSEITRSVDNKAVVRITKSSNMHSEDNKIC
jgi:hypothetical protein